MWIGTVVVALLLAVGLFWPVGLTSLIKDQLGSSLLLLAGGGILRTTIFLGYIALLSRLGGLRRVFEYHGAEHKTISCYEAGRRSRPRRAALLPAHPRWGQAPAHRDIVAIFLFAPIGLPAWYWLGPARILGVRSSPASRSRSSSSPGATATSAGCAR